MNLYRNDRGSNAKKIVFAVIVILALVLGTIVVSNGFSFDFLGFNSKSGSVLKSAKLKIDSEKAKIEEKKAKEEEIRKKLELEKKQYKVGTSHNNEATAWAYSTKDVNNWILNPSTYTGEKKLVFLTFDDGPSETYTTQALDIMKNYGVHGTFFIIGRGADTKYATPILQRQLEEGHAIGLHSYSHNYSFLYPGRVANVNNILSEVDQNLVAIRKSLGENFKTPVLRFPGGHMSWKGMSAIDEALAQRNIYNIDWNVLTGDAEARGSRRDLQGALENVKENMAAYGSGGPKVVVVLMHDIKPKSIDALPSIIEYYISLGYEFGILS